MNLPHLCELQKQVLDWNLDALLRPVAPEGKRGSYQRCFTPLITLWYLIFQRLSPDQTLATVIFDALSGGADALARADCQPSQKLKSSQTSSYSDARQRFPESVLLEVYQHSARKLESTQTLGSLTKVQLIDGTLLAMLTNPELSQAYPPASNQHGPSPWSQMRCVAAFEWHHGGAVAAAQATTSASEQVLAWEIFRQSAPGTLSIGDRNFGVFSVVQAARHHQQHVLVRLTAVRAKRLGGSSHWRSGQEQVVSWTPTRHDQLRAEAQSGPVLGRLIFVRVERPGFKPIELWLFTTLMDLIEFSVPALLQLYGIRWRAEGNFRYLKAQLKLTVLTAESPAMVRKEFYAALIAYNLVRQAMESCAKILQVPVTRVSFQAVRRALRHGLAELVTQDGGHLRRLRGLLLPTRSKLRPNEPRVVRERPRIFPKLRGSRSEARIRTAEACQSDFSPKISTNPAFSPKS
jgi:hypothetical protein